MPNTADPRIVYKTALAALWELGGTARPNTLIAEIRRRTGCGEPAALTAIWRHMDCHHFELTPDLEFTLYPPARSHAENAERALQLLAVIESGADTVDLQKHRQGQDGKRATPGA